MIDFTQARKKMLTEQLINRGIRDKKVLKAFGTVERHLFVKQKDMRHAYSDKPLLIDYSQTISQPFMVALMTQLLELEGIERILEIGTGSGYQTAILAELAKEVYSVERIPELAQHAHSLIANMKYSNIHIKTGNGTLGWPEMAPFDSIIVTAGAPVIPDDLVNQLKDKGKLIIPVGSKDQQELNLITKKGTSYTTKNICGCVFVPLIGERGWEE